MDNIPPKAMEFWRNLSNDAKKAVVETSWCGTCMKAVTIENYTLVFKKPDLLLKGYCKECSGDVVRLVEGA